MWVFFTGEEVVELVGLYRAQDGVDVGAFEEIRGLRNERFLHRYQFEAVWFVLHGKHLLNHVFGKLVGFVATNSHCNNRK